jgi:hypothetical protein
VPFVPQYFDPNFDVMRDEDFQVSAFTMDVDAFLA